MKRFGLAMRDVDGTLPDKDGWRSGTLNLSFIDALYPKIPIALYFAG